MKALRLLALPLLAASAFVFSGCEIDSATDVQRSVGVDFSGFYTRSNSSNSVVPIVTRNSGAPVTSLQLRQGGDRLEGIDNNNIVFRGSIGTFDGTTASFELTGRTTAGNDVTISGTLSTSGGSNETGATTGTMRGTWIEGAFYAAVFAQASVPGVSSGGGGGGGGGGSDLIISPNSATVSIGSSQTFNASRSGSSVNVTWTLSSSIGTLSTFNGSSTTFTRTAGGSATLSASDGSRTASAAIN